MARLGQQRRQLHARGTTPDDEHLTRRNGLRQWPFHLVAGRGVDRTGEAEPFHIAPADALIAANAGADLGDPTLAGLDQQLPVGDVRASHPDDRSAWPAARIRSATSGELIRPVCTTGSDTAALRAPANSPKAPASM
jgi:hypothetical protein